MKDVTWNTFIPLVDLTLEGGLAASDGRFSTAAGILTNIKEIDRV